MFDLADIRLELAELYDLTPTPEKAEATQNRYARAARVISPIEWMVHAPYVLAIDALKRERNAVILAHNYMTPDIYHGVADVVGDSLQLAIEATKVEAEVIVQCGVHFMAETSKILNPSRRVLIPDVQAGCSLAESITPAGVAEMRAKYPGAPVVSYVNTTAEVKAVSDICCTSANALQIVEAMDSDTVIMTPDRYLASNVAAQSTKKVVWWDGACMVHELYTADDVRAFRADRPDVTVIAHPECPPEVVAESDYTGSTSGIIDWLHVHRPQEVLLMTECSMASNIADELPGVNFARPCNMCPHMKRITLEKVLWSIHSMTTEVTVDEVVADSARRAVQRMIDVTRRGTA